ncbi:MAG TPA: hypothetical protein PK944_09535 [Agitococcus sp.]|nr:hypothetical protein [Agitococcus sp.]
MNTSEGLIPKWDKWLNMIDATDFQLVALSLNYEPPSTLKTITRFQGLLCYAQRLSIIKNHITNKQLPYEQRRCSSTDKFENYVQLNAFVKWAVDVMAWDLPPELLTVYNASAPLASSQKLIEENELLRQQLSDAQAKIDVLKKQLNEYQEKPIAIKTENKVMPLIYHLCCQLLNNGKPVERSVQKTLSFITDDLKNKRGIELGSKALDDYYKLGEKIINEKNR